RSRRVGRKPQATRHLGVDRGAARSRVEHESKGPPPIDRHRRPNAPDAIASRGCHEARLGRLDDNLRESLGWIRRRGDCPGGAAAKEEAGNAHYAQPGTLTAQILTVA